MKHLIIYTHLNPQSFTKAVVDEVEKESLAKNHEVKIIDLYKDNFNPVLGMPDIKTMSGGETPKDVKAYQDLLVWGDHYTFVYPLWWGQMPAMLKGFIDRVFTNGFAFNYTEKGPEPLMTDKTVKVIINTGTPSELYAQSGMHDAQKRVLDGGLFGFCGIKTDIVFFGNVAIGPQELREEYLKSIKELV